MRKPDVGQEVQREINSKIDDFKIEKPFLSRRSIARKILKSKEGWYKQTPEGEYLEWVAEGERK